MTRIGLLRGALVVTISLLFVVAGSASAKTALETTEMGTPATVGTNELSFQSPECAIDSHGTVLTNGKPKDKFGFEPPFARFCAPGVSISGAITQVLVTATGKWTTMAKPKVAITEPGPCVYEFSKFTFTFEVTRGLETTGTATGKLNKKTSAAGCGPTLTSAIVTSVIDKAEKHPLETELIG
jgi:hypothetical protein